MPLRLDQALVQRSLSPSREKAKELIKNNQVLVNDQVIDKPSFEVKEEDRIAVTGPTNPFVSRGGLKLEKALDSFSLDMTDKTCLDIGASTGGFTDCMLSRGAKTVVAIDVGTGQLAEKLLQDPRVINMEQTNVRTLTPSDLPSLADFASVDVSFISLEKVLPSLAPLLKENGEIVCLIKPQFEAGKQALNKKGIVKDPKIHEKVLHAVLSMATDLSLYPLGLTFSPIRGPEGNIEYLVYLKKGASFAVPPMLQSENLSSTIHAIVTQSHQETR